MRRPLLAGMPEPFHIHVKEVAQSSGGVFIVGDSKDCGCSLEQPALAGLLGAGTLDQLISRCASNLNHSVTQWFIHSSVERKGLEPCSPLHFHLPSWPSAIIRHRVPSHPSWEALSLWFGRCPAETLYWNSCHKEDISLKKQSIDPCQMGCQSCTQKMSVF